MVENPADPTKSKIVLTLWTIFQKWQTKNCRVRKIKAYKKTAVPNSGYIVQDAPSAIGKDYNDYLLAARRLISVER